jgi:hypothetical protein
LALNSEAIHRVGVDLNRIQNEPGFANSLAIICVLHNGYNVSRLISNLELWKSLTSTAFLYEIALSSVLGASGTYFYLCFLCNVKQTLIKVHKPSVSLNDLDFQEKRENFEILLFSGNVSRDTRMFKYYCTGRHNTFRSMQCK